MKNTPEPPDEFPAGFGAKLALVLTPFALAALVWWLLAG